jgi:protein-S-isoprenylcysteine O-methyltransferase Ste14
MTFENNKMISQIIFILIWPVLLIFLSGNWFWVEGYVFGIWFVTLSMSRIIYLHRKDLELLKERSKKPGTGNQRGMDKYIVYMIAALFLTWFVVMPLDAERYSGTANFPVLLKILGGILLIISFFFLYRSYTDNTFLSPLVRIQTKRKHQVVSTGVYSFVRHPMYLGAILLFTGTPLLFGSKYGVLIGVLMVFLVAVRIIGEEKLLDHELEGYSDYKNKVKNRLIPYIW